MSPRHARHGLTIGDLLAILIITVLLSGALLIAAEESNEAANRVKCAANLKQIGQGLTLYANENRGAFPRATWKPGEPPTAFTNWRAPNPFAAGGPAPNDVTAALYLLLRTQDMLAYTFVCPSSPAHPLHVGPKPPLQGAARGTGPAPGQAGVEDPVSAAAQKALAAQQPRSAVRQSPPGVPQPIGEPVAEKFTELSNFPGLENLSYSVANPYPSAEVAATDYRWNFRIGADFAVAADLNPGSAEVLTATAAAMPPLEPARPAAGYTTTSWKFADSERAANSPNHQGFGQNILYGDGHVSWQATPFAGPNRLGRDNIYTRYTGVTAPQPPDSAFVGSPADEKDSMLLPTARTKP